MIILIGGDIVLPDRTIAGGSIVVQGDRIAAVEAHRRSGRDDGNVVDVSGCYVVPGFIDVHVHGVEGIDALDGDPAVNGIAARLPRYGVTAFCPTTVACSPADLRDVLSQVRQARRARPAESARVLPAHLESNFLNPEFRGAQPADCLRLPPNAMAASFDASTAPEGSFAAREILDVISSAPDDVGIVTLAPELPGGLELVRALVSGGCHVSLGHSGATFEEAMAAIDAGARQATHLFNRMSPMGHRAPGLPGAVLARPDVLAELIFDGYHVHAAICRLAIAVKGTRGIMAITDGTSGSGLPPGSRARLGGRPIQVGDHAALLDDGTLAGSTATMDGVLRTIVTGLGLSIAEAAAMCATTPARALGLDGWGVIAEGAVADLTVLDRSLHVMRTFVAGVEVYTNRVVDER